MQSCFDNICTFKGLNSMGELFAELVSINRSFLVEWSFILVIPKRLEKKPPECFLCGSVTGVSPLLVGSRPGGSGLVKRTLTYFS